MKLSFEEDIKFSAAHYIPDHPKCGGIHGHTYFVRNLTVEVDEFDKNGMSIDFGIIKDYFKREWDHKFIIPTEDADFWKHIYEECGNNAVADNRKLVKHTTAEYMAEKMQEDLINIFERRYTPHFTLCEGPDQGVEV